METKFILINNLTESLVFNLYDYNDHRKNTLLGSSTFELMRLQEDATLEGLASQLLMDGKERGELRYDVSFFPVLTPEDGEDTSQTCKRLLASVDCSNHYNSVQRSALSVSLYIKPRSSMPKSLYQEISILWRKSFSAVPERQFMLRRRSSIPTTLSGSHLTSSYVLRRRNLSSLLRLLMTAISSRTPWLDICPSNWKTCWPRRKTTSIGSLSATAKVANWGYLLNGSP